MGGDIFLQTARFKQKPDSFLEDIEKRTVALKSKGKTFRMAISDNASEQALKVLLLEITKGFLSYT